MRALRSNPDSIELMDMFNQVSINQRLFHSEKQLNLEQISQGRNCMYVLSANDLMTERPFSPVDGMVTLQNGSVESRPQNCLVYLTNDYSPLVELDLKNSLLFKLIM
jgi:hypothetical protein